MRIRRTVARKDPGRNYQDARQPREDETVPSLCLLNAAGLAKPHAIEHLAADLTSNGTDVAIVTETHFNIYRTEPKKTEKEPRRAHFRPAF